MFGVLISSAFVYDVLLHVNMMQPFICQHGFKISQKKCGHSVLTFINCKNKNAIANKSQYPLLASNQKVYNNRSYNEPDFKRVLVFSHMHNQQQKCPQPSQLKISKSILGSLCLQIYNVNKQFGRRETLTTNVSSWSLLVCLLDQFTTGAYLYWKLY